MPPSPLGLMRDLTQPAVSVDSRAQDVVMSAVRVLAGLLWLYNVGWKLPPDFGESSGTGVYGFSQDAVDHPVLPPYSWLVETLVLPNFPLFGWLVLVAETALAVLLLTGTAVRLAAAIGVGQSLAIGLSVAFTPGEWPWSYWLMIGLHLALLFTASGRVAAVDAVRADAAAGRTSAAVRLLRLWGVVVAAAGVVALLLSLGADPLASAGEQLGGPDLSVSLGSYNLVGALALVAVGGLLVASAQLRQGRLGYAAAVVSALAAASIYVQLTRTDVWLGGSNVSAGLFCCAAVVGAVAGWAVTTLGAPRTERRAG